MVCSPYLKISINRLTTKRWNFILSLITGPGLFVVVKHERSVFLRVCLRACLRVHMFVCVCGWSEIPFSLLHRVEEFPWVELISDVCVHACVCVHARPRALVCVCVCVCSSQCHKRPFHSTPLIQLTLDFPKRRVLECMERCLLTGFPANQWQLYLGRGLCVFMCKYVN